MPAEEMKSDEERGKEGSSYSGSLNELDKARTSAVNALLH